jgi:SAM-dependent methyltransferase
VTHRLVARFDSITPEYTRAFQTFLAHTDQKEKALVWLDHEIAALAQRRTAIDVGAGTGILTRWVAERFQTVVAIEPNPSLGNEFRAACPTVPLIAETILSAEPGVTADFVLCSHVFYYIPRPEWEENVRRLISWLAPGGVLAIAIQNRDTDCMRMVDHFFGERLDLRRLAEAVESSYGSAFDVRLDTVEAHVRTADLETACNVAEFALNVMPLRDPPGWDALEQYVATHFARTGGGFEYSCHQDFLRIARRG